MFASTALNAGIGTITPMRSSLTGRPRSGIAVRREPGSISTTILTLMRLKTLPDCVAHCSEHKAFVENEWLAISSSAWISEAEVRLAGSSLTLLRGAVSAAALRSCVTCVCRWHF